MVFGQTLVKMTEKYDVVWIVNKNKNWTQREGLPKRVSSKGTSSLGRIFSQFSFDSEMYAISAAVLKPKDDRMNSL
jgi:hypothetical protein